MGEQTVNQPAIREDVGMELARLRRTTADKPFTKEGRRARATARTLDKALRTLEGFDPGVATSAAQAATNRRIAAVYDRVVEGTRPPVSMSGYRGMLKAARTLKRQGVDTGDKVLELYRKKTGAEFTAADIQAASAQNRAAAQRNRKLTVRVGSAAAVSLLGGGATLVALPDGAPSQMAGVGLVVEQEQTDLTSATESVTITALASTTTETAPETTMPPVTVVTTVPLPAAAPTTVEQTTTTQSTTTTTQPTTTTTVFLATADQRHAGQYATDGSRYTVEVRPGDGYLSIGQRLANNTGDPNYLINPRETLIAMDPEDAATLEAGEIIATRRCRVDQGYRVIPAGGMSKPAFAELVHVPVDVLDALNPNGGQGLDMTAGYCADVDPSR